MKHTIRILSAVLALSMLLTGCSLWKPMVSKTPEIAATYGDGQTLTTGEYLAYLYYHVNKVMLEAYYTENGADATTKTYTYGEGDAKKTDLSFDEYVVLLTQDTIKKQIALEQLMAEYGISFKTDEDYKKYDYVHSIYETIQSTKANYEPGTFLPLGISDEHHWAVNDKLYYDQSYLYEVFLDEEAAFFGLYGKGGAKEVPDKEIRAYFDENYISYKSIQITLTKDVDGQETDMTADEKKAEKKKLQGYLAICNKDGFEKAMDAYNKDLAADDETVEASTDEQNRQNVDKKNMDENLVKAIEEAIKDKKLVKGGKAAIIEYKAGGTTSTYAMIQLLDPNEPKTVYEDAYESILFELKHEEYQKLVADQIKKVKIDFNKDVLAICTVEQMMADMDKASE